MSKSIKSQSPAASQPGMADPLVDSMLDFSGYDDGQYQNHSPSLSPSACKTQFVRPVNAVQQQQQQQQQQQTPASLLSTSQQMSGPSHQYDLYKQQTGIVPGALASTLQVNQNNAQITGYQAFDLESYLGIENNFDFNTSPSQQTMGASDVDMDFDSPPAEQSLFYNEQHTVNPNVIGGQEAHGLPSPPVMSSQSHVGRMWPGMHQQAAIQKAQAQQRQQQQIIAQQQHQARANQQQGKHQRPKNSQPSDPIVEQKITQLLNSMRAKSGGPDSMNNAPLMNLPRPRKDEEDMDEDERLLASEEGKKLSSKERRQLRNKVSARAFRSRRKEYIGQLEAEIAGKVTENGDLRSQNRALIDENKRLSDLTRMLLSSPSFSDFLDRLSTNPTQVPQPAPQVEQRQEVRQAPKDVNAYAARQAQHQQIGMAMIPEQAMDFSMLNIGNADAYNYQPQVYAVLETPEVPVTIEASVLSGKSSSFIGSSFDASEDEKVEMPVIERPAAVVEEKATAPAAHVEIDDEFENDPEFALYHSSAASTTKTEEILELDTEVFSHVDIFGGIESEKVLAHYQLIDATKEEASAAMAMARVQSISASLESLTARLEMLTVDI